MTFKTVTLLRVYVQHPTFMLTSVRIGWQNREQLDMLHIIPKLRKKCTGADSRDQEAAAEPVVLQRCLACYVRDHTMKSCQPLGSGLINKAFRAAQESDKPQHSKPFPGHSRGLSASSWHRCGHCLPSGSQDRSARLIVSGLCDTVPVAWVSLIIWTASCFVSRISQRSEKTVGAPSSSQ